MITEKKHILPPNKGKAKAPCDRSTQRRRSLRYDSADSSDSGVGVESAVWSPCSSLSYSPPPLLSDPDDDLSEGCPPPSPPQSEPPSPEDPHLRPPCHESRQQDLTGTACSRLSLRMAPNDARSPSFGDPEKRLMGGCGFPADEPLNISAPGLQELSVTPHKDRPPDCPLVSPTGRARRMTSSGISPRSPRKRGGTDGPRVDPERRTKTLRGGAISLESSTSDISGSDLVKINGQVTTEPALLARLAGLTGSEEIRGRCSPRTRCSPGGLSGLHQGKESDKLTGGRLNGLRRHNHIKDLNVTINNNISSRNKNIEGDLLEDHHPPPPTLSPPLSLQDVPLGDPSSTSSSSVSASSLTPALLTSSRLSTSSSCSSSSGIGSSLSTDSCGSGSSSTSSSAPTSGASTPTPKVRFPAPQKKDSKGDICRWRGCGLLMCENSSLLEHIQAVHVEGQLEAESFRCLWVGCKVFDRASCSVSWLERHVLTHGGHKPFKCIVDGCGQRFASQNALGRHVNHHFNSLSSAPAPKPQNQSSPTKLIRKNGRKLRYRKRPWSARIFDFFDLSAMEQVRYGLIHMSQVQQDKSSNHSHCDTINFTPKVLARRKNPKGDYETLVTWSPPGMLPDEWLTSDDELCHKNVSLSNLSHEGRLAAGSLCFPGHPHRRPHNSRKRVPIKAPATPIPTSPSPFTTPLPPKPLSRPTSSTALL